MCLKCGYDFCDCGCECDYPENVLSQAIKDALAGEIQEIDGYIGEAKQAAVDADASAARSEASAVRAKASEVQAALSAATAVEAASTAVSVTGDLPTILDRLERLQKI